MAHLRKGILGAVQGGIDGLIGRVIYGRGIIQSKGETGKNSQRLGSTAPQDQMFWLRWWLTQIPADYFTFILKPSKKIWTSQNEWIKRNFNSVDIEGVYTPDSYGFTLGKKQAPLGIVIVGWDAPLNSNTSLIIDVPNANTIPDALAVFLCFNITQKKFLPFIASNTYPFEETGIDWTGSDVGDQGLIIAFFIKFPDPKGLNSSPAVFLEVTVGG